MHRSTNPVQPERSFRIRRSAVASPSPFRVRWTEVAATAVVTGLVIGGTVWAFNIATSPAEDVTPACATEGDTGCFWDATTRGNGIGNSFYTDESGNTYYLPDTECADNLAAWTWDASQMIEDMDSRWASSAPYSVSVRTDNIDPMTDRLDYILTTLCD